MKQTLSPTIEHWKHSGSEGESLSPTHPITPTSRTSSFSPREEQFLPPRSVSRASIRKDMASPLQLKPLPNFSSRPDSYSTLLKPPTKLSAFTNFSSGSTLTTVSSSSEDYPDLFQQRLYTYTHHSSSKLKKPITTKSKNHPPVKKEYLGSQLNFYHKAISTSPQAVEDYINLGKVYLKKGDNPMAISYFKQALQLDPKPFHFFVLGNALLNNRSFTEAEEIFKQAKTLISGVSSTKHDLSSHTIIRTLSTDIDIYKIKHKLMVIINRNINILELINKNAIEGIKQTYLTIGDACAIYTNYDSSTTKMLEMAVIAYSKAGIIEAYHKIIKLDPENTYGQTAIAFYDLGQFNSEEDPHKAINYFKRAISLSPEFVDAYIMTAALYQDEEDLTRAGEYYKKATKYFPQLHKILCDIISQGLSAEDSPPLIDSSLPKNYHPAASSAEELADIIFYFYTNEYHYSESCKELTQTIELLGTI